MTIDLDAPLPRGCPTYMPDCLDPHRQGLGAVKALLHRLQQIPHPASTEQYRIVASELLLSASDVQDAHDWLAATGQLSS